MWDLNSLTRDRTCSPCIRRQILNHWTTSKVPCCCSFKTSIIGVFDVPRAFLRLFSTGSGSGACQLYLHLWLRTNTLIPLEILSSSHNTGRSAFVCPVRIIATTWLLAVLLSKFSLKDLFSVMADT